MELSIKYFPSEILKILLDDILPEKIKINYFNFNQMDDEMAIHLIIEINYHNCIIKRGIYMYRDINKLDFTDILKAFNTGQSYSYLIEPKCWHRRLVFDFLFEFLSTGQIAFLGNIFPDQFKGKIKQFILELSERCTFRNLNQSDINLFKKYNIDLSKYDGFNKQLIPKNFIFNNNFKPKYKLIDEIAPVYYTNRDIFVYFSDYADINNIAITCRTLINN